MDYTWLNSVLPVAGEKMRYSPLDPNRRPFEPGDSLSGSQITSSFERHQNRSPPSHLPGVDTDVTHHTEGLANGLRPIVRSPVSGRVQPPLDGGRYGTVKIRDASGYTHVLLHMRLNYEAPVSGRAFPLGLTLQIGDPIGFLGNTGTARDHLHQSLVDPHGRIVDPTKYYYGEDGRVTGPKTDNTPMPTGTPIRFDSTRPLNTGRLA